MIKSLAPRWAIGALAIHAPADPHLVEGTHYRLFTEPRFGLPMRPISIWRQNLGRRAKFAQSWFPEFPARRHDITWIDSTGRTLVAPFRVTPDNPVTGLLPTHAVSRCIWLELQASNASDIQVEIFRVAATGHRPLGSREEAPFSLGASDIDGVTVTGDGLVQDLIWLDVWRLGVAWDDPHNSMALPRPDGPRYQDPTGGANLIEAALRVRRGAPQRLGLHDDPHAIGAATATPATVGDELAKLEAMAPMVGDSLDTLLNDLTAPQHRLEETDLLTEGGVTPTPQATYKPVDLIHTGMHDPTMARWLGFMDVELPDEFVPDPEDVVVYQMWSYWALDPGAFTPVEATSFLPSMLGLVTDLEPGDDGTPAADESPDGLPIFELWVPAVAVGHTPPLRPTPPLLDAELKPPPPTTEDELGHWLPTDAPGARRQATIPVRGLVPAAGLAFTTDSDGTTAGLNERLEVDGGAFADRALLIVPTAPQDEPDPSAGRLVHRNIPEQGITVRVAQSDVFGRWSDWGERVLDAKIRPVPPEPVLDVWYTIADADAAGSGPLWGTLTARIQVPPAESLAPGSQLLSTIRLQGTVGSAAFEVDADAPDPQQGELVIEIPQSDPALLAVGQVIEATTTAVWIDTAGVESEESAPRVTTCVDPRPPLPATAPPTLEWASRPDATGRSRVKLEWARSGAQERFRVYACDEQRLVHKATEDEEIDFTSFLAAHDGAADLPSRAQVLRDYHDLFPVEWFQNLTDAPLETEGSGPMSFQHELSGSLGVLAVYKVVAETDAGTQCDFIDTPLWVWAVPEKAGPPQPLLELIGTDPGPPHTATLRVRLTGRPEAAGRYRLRRSSVHSDPRRMPPAQEGPIVLAPDEKHFDIVDDGRFVHDAAYELQSGALYSWTVEVQAPDLPGSTKPGAWSRPSASVATRIRSTHQESAV